MNHASNDDLIIGVDGGGTTTVAWVAPLDDPTNSRVLGRGEAGPGNPRAVGFEFAQMTIGFAIAQALADAGRPREPVAALHLGLAGAGRDSEQKRMERWAIEEVALARKARVTSDAEPILASASPDDCGVALIGGTGSLAWGQNARGDIARTGGWGHLIGDEGSAYAIALAGLRAVMQASDGRRPETALWPAFQRHLEVQATSEIIERIYSPEMTRDRIAACAIAVFETADDPAAARIIAEAADSLARMVTTLADRLQLLADGYPLAIAGSLLLNQESLRNAVLEQLAVHQASPQAVSLVTEPVRGAVALARRLARE